MPSRYETKTREDGGIPFFPNHLLSEVALSFLIIGLLLVVSGLFPLGPGEKVDPLNPPTTLEPEWYFMAVYQFLKTESVQPFHGVLLSAMVGLFLVAIPFLEVGKRAASVRRLISALVLVGLTQLVVLTFYGYATPGQAARFMDFQFILAFTITNLVSGVLILRAFLKIRKSGSDRGSAFGSRRQDSKRGVPTNHSVQILHIGTAFVLGVFGLGVLLPALLKLAVSPTSLELAVESLVGLGAVSFSVFVLGRYIYRVDRKAGRVTKRLSAFES